MGLEMGLETTWVRRRNGAPLLHIRTDAPGHRTPLKGSINMHIPGTAISKPVRMLVQYVQ